MGTLGYQAITASTTGISSEVDIAGGATTVTVGNGRRIKITGFCAYFSGGGADSYNLEIKEGTTILQAVTVTNPGNGEVTRAEVILTPSAGSHPYKLAAVHTLGSVAGVFNASATSIGHILVEDIGV